MGVDDKTEGNQFHFFVELLLEHVTVNETEALIEIDRIDRNY